MSATLGVFAMAMGVGLYMSIVRNASMVDEIKAMESPGLATPRPTRSAKQAAAFLFGESNLSLRCLIPVEVRPSMTENLVLAASEQMYQVSGSVASLI